MAPLFLLWAIRGNPLVPDRYFLPICLALIIAPTAFLFSRVRAAVAAPDTRILQVGNSSDHRDHILVYLIATLMPFYTQSPENWRDLIAMVVAVVFIVYLFWRLNLHYLNLVFVWRGYNIFTVYPPDDDNPFTGSQRWILITPRTTLAAGIKVDVYRLSDTVFLESTE